MKRILFACTVVFFGLTLNAGPSVRTKFMSKLKAKAEHIKKSMHSMTMEAKVTVNSPRGTLIMQEKIYKLGDNHRVDSTFVGGGLSKRMPAMFANMKTVTLMTPKGIWMISPMGRHEVKNKKRLPPGIETTSWLTQISHHIGKVHKVPNGFLVELKNTGKWTEALFSNKLDIIQMIGQNTNGKQLKTVFQDYSDAGGLHMPRHIISYMGKSKIFDMRIIKAQKNPSLSPSLFDPDKINVKPLHMMP